MAGNIKGITIEFKGDTTKLSSALTSIKNDTKNLNSSLKDVDRALKFNPRNTELLAQKQTLLKGKIDATKQRLDAFKQAQAQMDAAGVDKTSQEYMEVRRNIIQAESQVKHFNSELKKVQAALSPLGKLGTKFQETGEKISDAGHKLAPVSKAAGAVAAGLGAMAVKSGRAADDINTLSKVSGISTKKLQLYAASADLVDVSVEDMAKAQTKMKKSMFIAAKGTGDAATAFKRLGVSVTDSKGHLRSQDQVFQETIKKLGQMKNETERDALAMQIFGKTATNLNPMIKDLGKTYGIVTETMKKNKIKFIDQSTLDEANKFNDELDKIKLLATTGFQQVGSKIAAALLPAITKIGSVVGKILGFLANVNGKTLALITGIAGGFAILAPVLIVVGGLINKLGLAFSTLARIAPGVSAAMGRFFGVFKAHPIILVIAALAALAFAIQKSGLTATQISAKIQGIVTRLVTKIPALLNGLISAIIKLLPVMVSGAVTLFNGLVQALPKVLPALVKGAVRLITSVINQLPKMIPALFKAAKALFIAIVKAIPVVAKAVLRALPKIVNAFKNGLARALPVVWNAIKNKMVGAFSGMLNAAKNKFQAIKSAITRPIEKAKEILGKIIEKIKNVFNKLKLKLGIKIPHIHLSGGKAPWGIAGKGKLPSFSVDWHAKGGIFTKPTVFATPFGLQGFGEAGAEAILPLSRLQIMLDASHRQNDAMMTKVIELLNILVDQGNQDKTIRWNKRELFRLLGDF